MADSHTAKQVTSVVNAAASTAGAPDTDQAVTVGIELAALQRGACRLAVSLDAIKRKRNFRTIPFWTHE